MTKFAGILIGVAIRLSKMMRMRLVNTIRNMIVQLIRL